MTNVSLKNLPILKIVRLREIVKGIKILRGACCSSNWLKEKLVTTLIKDTENLNRDLINKKFDTLPNVLDVLTGISTTKTKLSATEYETLSREWLDYEKFYRALADLNGQTIAEVLQILDEVNTKLEEITLTSEEIDWESGITKDILNFLNLTCLIDNLVKEKWSYLHPEIKTEIIGIAEDIINHSSSKKNGLLAVLLYKWRQFKFVSSLFVKSLMIQRNLIRECREVLLSLIDSILKSIIRDREDQADWEAYLSAKEKIDSGEMEFVSWDDYESGIWTEEEN